jgi:hypothetical protein
MRKSLFIAFALLVVTLAGEEEVLAPFVDSDPAGETGFREIGSFQVTKAVVTKLGKTTEIPKGKLVFRVFTDGIDIRISPDGQDDDFLAFQIYRNGGVYDLSGKNLRPGVQAFSDQGEVVRHLVIDSKLLTLTKFPTSTSDVEIIYATRYER